MRSSCLRRGGAEDFASAFIFIHEQEGDERTGDAVFNDNDGSDDVMMMTATDERSAWLLLSRCFALPDLLRKRNETACVRSIFFFDEEKKNTICSRCSLSLLFSLSLTHTLSPSQSSP